MLATRRFTERLCQTSLVAPSHRDAIHEGLVGNAETACPFCHGQRLVFERQSAVIGATRSRFLCHQFPITGPRTKTGPPSFSGESLAALTALASHHQTGSGTDWTTEAQHLAAIAWMVFVNVLGVGRAQHEVLQTIITRIAVFVVNAFTRAKLSPQVGLHHKTVVVFVSLLIWQPSRCSLLSADDIVVLCEKLARFGGKTAAAFAVSHSRHSILSRMSIQPSLREGFAC